MILNLPVVRRRKVFASPSGIALPRRINARPYSNSPIGTSESVFTFRTVLSEVVRPADRVFRPISGAGFAAASELAAIAARARAKKDGMLGTKQIEYYAGKSTRKEEE